MSHQLSFGMYEGRTYEWVFFHAPWYAEYIYEHRIHRQQHNFSEEEGDYFAELFRRASMLTGVCSHCKQRPIARMCLTSHYKTCETSFDGFYCDGCEYNGPSMPWYHDASFFVEEYKLRKKRQLEITEAIKHHYIGPGNLTQQKMEAFFRTDKYFVDATPEFFKTSVVEA